MDLVQNNGLAETWILGMGKEQAINELMLGCVSVAF